MSTSAPWNFQPATKDTGNVKLFNPQENTSLQNGQIPSTDGGNVTHPSSWNNTGWETNNQYGQYNNVMNDDDTVQNTGESHDQNEYQAQQFGESQQFYNLNPGIQQSYNQGQFIQQNDPQGQPIQQYDPQGQPIQQYDPQGQPIQQYDPQSQPIQQYDPQGQPIQQYEPQSQPIQQYGPQCQPIQQYGPQCQPIPQYDPQGQAIQQYDPQGQAIQQYDPQGQAIQQFDPQGQPIQHYNQQYGLNNQWNNCDGYQQNWNGSLAEQPSSSAATEAQFDEDTNPQSNYDENQQCITNNSENIQNSDYTENIGTDSVPPMINENSIPSSDISTHDSSGLSSELDHNHLILQPPLQTEISGESLVTLNSSSTQLTGEDSQLNIENQMENLSVQEKSENSVKSGDVNHSAVDGQASSVDGNPSKTSKDSPVNSQTSDDWEMVPSAHNLLAPSNHSRQGSADSSSNVHFFIGSTNISPSGTPDGEVTHQSDKKQEESSPPSKLIPKHSSSPMPPRSGVLPQKHGDSQPSSSLGQGPPTMPPPTGSMSTESNPFRKGNRSGGGQNSAKSVPTSNLTQSGEKGETTPTSKNDELKLDVSVAEGGFPSPIPAVPEESQNPPSQSPIMPRKESPFQPPRRRNMSQSSNSFDDENVPLHSDQRLTGSHKSDHIQKENDNIERKVGGADRKIGPMKADRPFRSMMQSTSERQQDSRIDYNKYSSYRGKDEKRPRSPITSSSVRNPGSDRITPTRPPTGRTTPTKPSSGRTTPGRSTPSRRLEREAYQKVVERRKKENVSPATSLWANNDIVPKTNILLAPAAPLQSTTPIIGVLEQKHRVETREVLSPVENLITTMTDHLSRENSPEKDVAKSKTTTQDVNRRENTQKDRHERNSSIDREIEMTKRMGDRERLYENNRDRPYKDDRNNRGPVRDDRNPAYRDDRQRDSRDYRDRDRDYDRDKYYDAYYEKQRQERSRDPYYNDERYERPRSRQSAVDDRVPSHQDQSKEKARNDRDAYYHDRYGQKGYYDYYGNGRQYGAYYDQRYADYYGDSRYSKAYYDEYYSGQQYQQDNYDRMSRYDYTWQNAGYYDQYRQDDAYSQRSDSRVHTPGSLSDSGDQPDGYNKGSRTSSRQGYPDDYHRGHYDPYYYGYEDYYDNSYREPEPPGRMTPEKYTIPHICARFGPGGHLIKVMPNRPKEGQTATVEIHDISTMLEDRPEVEELKCFPGPLVRGDTHKNDVLSFCQQRSKACSENINMTDRDSAELIWKLLELLIKQNGMIVGTDIADLLLEGHEPTTVEYSLMGMKISNSMDNIDMDLDETNEVSTVTMDRSVINRGQRSREEITDRFRHLLLYGRKKDALDWAMKNSLWGHALFLASKMDSKAHANVMTKFANSAMKMNDPLQTLYQLMSGRQPAAVSCITDERWGDWRPHLAMVLSNQTHRADLDRKCIMTMGDTLASRGFLHASHFCYLMAQAGFGSYHKKTSKMVLIGSNHSFPLSEFATNEAMQCSEVYEYALSLGNPSFYSPNLQYFKFLYACRMAENGFAQQAIEYCEVIAKCINISPTVFQPTLVKLVYELANRLKKFDPEKQQVGEDSEDPMWLQHLQRINQGFEDGSIQPLSGSATPYCFLGTRSSSASGEVAGLTDMAGIQPGSYTGSTDSPLLHGQNQPLFNQVYNTDQIQNQVHTNDQNQYHHGNANNLPHNQFTTDTVHDPSQLGDQSQTQGYNVDQSHPPDQGYQSGQIQQPFDQGQGYAPQGQGYTDQGQGYTNQGQMYQDPLSEQQQQQQHYTQDGQAGYQYQHHDLQTVPETANQNQGYNTENLTGETTTTNYTPQNDFSMYNQTGIQSEQRHSISSGGTMSTHADTDDEESLNQSQKSDFDYFGAATNQQRIVPPRLRKRTESESSQVNAPKSSDSNKTEIKPEEKKDDKKNSQSKGWFGGVFSKLMPKSKNEMKLPDDKDPTIVWDPVKKKWTNQDGDAEDEKPPAPPPKDMDLSSGSTPAHLPSSSSSTPAMGPPSGNRYGRPRGRGARTQYVDVMNPKTSGETASVPSDIFNVMPSSASSPAIFNPSHGSDATDSSQKEIDTAQSNMPPSDQRIDSGEISQSSSTSSLSREIQQYMQRESTEMPPPSSGPPSMPMLFNPSQMTQSTTNITSQPGLKRYNQRRVYPKS